MTKRVAILLSGGGSNMVALAQSMTGEHPARPVLVVANRPDAGGLEKAERLGIDTVCIDHRLYEGRGPFERALTQRLAHAGADIICLAGFMRVLTPVFVDRWAGRMLNIHPSLLPRYPGLRTHQRALDAGDHEAGCTVHEVTTELDAGPALGQARVAVEPGDTAETLAKRVLAMEHVLYPAVLRRFAQGDRSPITLSRDADALTKIGPST
ncbi:MAG: phosphoribosylglycinamide formyltransferase [Pseudomonadota bacterium]